MNRTIIPILLIALAIALGANSCGSEAVSPVGNSGKGGSMARFTVVDKYLYTIDNFKMHIYDLSSPAQPVKVKDLVIGSDVETIFPYAGKLFIGSQSGMDIYDISQPANPVRLSSYAHITSCDPVVVQGNRAYVTLRSGTGCDRGRNLLDIIDISDPTAPKLIISYPMQNPHGLGIDGNILFICEGAYGLKVFDIAQPTNMRQIAHVEDIDAYDVIPLNKNLILTGKSGVFQFDYTQPEKLVLRSKLKTNTCQ